MPNSSLTVHPEHVSICFLITALVAPPPPATGWGSSFDGPTAQRLLALFLLEELQDVCSPVLPSLPQLLLRLQQQLGEAGSCMARVMITCLSSLQTPDDIVGMNAQFGGFLALPGTTPEHATEVDSIAYIASSSPLGLFLRRVRLGLESMSLQGMSALAAAIQMQLQEAETQLQHPSQAAQHISEQQQPLASGAFKEPAVLDAYLNLLLAAVQSLGPSLPAATVQAAVAALSRHHDGLSKLQYLDLAVSLAQRDMSAALSALHQYFDTNGTSSGSVPSSGATGPGAAVFTGGGSSSSKSKGQHQAALHNLAALHATLGHPQEALAALQELLALGQQHGDEWSILHGLSSLCRVIGASEGLPNSSSRAQAGTTTGAPHSSSAASSTVDSLGVLDLRRTEQQLQLQALLQRCLQAARDMRVPHIAAFAAVALCRFRLVHASSNGAGTLDGSAETPGLSSSSPSSAAAAVVPSSTSLTVQRMLLDIATLEHQAAVAAAAPGTPAIVAAATAGGPSQGQLPAAGLATRPSELYNPTEAFGLGAGASTASASSTGSNRLGPPGAAWRSSAAAVSQALAAGHVLAASALQLQGAHLLAGVKALMVLNGPGGAGVHDATVQAVLPAAAAAAAAAARDGGDADSATAARRDGGVAQEAAAAAAAAEEQGILCTSKQLTSTAALTGSAVDAEDVAGAWMHVVQVAEQLQGTSTARHALTLAESHFPSEIPQQLASIRESIRLKAALQRGDFTGARLVCEDLQGLAPPVPELALELQLAAAEAHVQLLQASGCFAEAHQAAAALFATAASAGMQPQAVAALLRMSEACVAAGDAAGALQYALSSFLHVQVLHLDTLLPEAVLQVATAWQELAPDSMQFALQLLQQVQPLAHAGGRLKMRADIEEGVARLQLLDALHHSRHDPAAAASITNTSAAGSSEVIGAESEQECRTGHTQGVRQRLSAAAVMLQKAGEVKAAAGCWLLLAHVCNTVGLEQDRNDAALQWQLCRQRCTSGSMVM